MKKRIISIFLCLIMLIPLFFQTNTLKNLKVASAPYQDKIKAVFLNVNEDFSENTTENEYMAMLDSLGAIGLNTLIINTSSENTIYYGSDIDTLSDDIYPVDMLVSCAQKCGFSVYMVIDINLALSECETLYNAPQTISHIISGVISRYNPQGLIPTNFGFEADSIYFEEYLEFGGAIGFENYVNELSHKTINSVSEAITSNSNDISFGVFDSNTDIDYDFVISHQNTTLSDNKDLLTICDNSFIENADAQYLTDMLIDIETYSDGVVFSKCSPLLNTENECVDTVKRYFADALDIDTLGNELLVSTPTQQSFSTKEASIIFSGSFDSNFDLIINDEIIDTMGENTFSVEMPLDIGQNSFTITNSSNVLTYTITRNVNIFNTSTLSPSSDVSVDGANTLSISVYAYPGSVLNATLNSVTMQMEQTQTTDSLGYRLYKCTFTMPPTIPQKQQQLGRISITGTYNGYSESLSGANVTVPAGAAQTTPVTPDAGDNEATGEIFNADSGNGVVNPNATVSGTVIKVTTDNATVFDSVSTERIPKPTFMKLAANTIDFLSKTVTYEGVDYYITKSGRRIKTELAVLLSESSINENNIIANCAYMSGNNTVIKLSQDYKTPYCILYSPINFLNNNYGDWGDYFLNSFSPDTISIVFDYCTAASGNFNFPENALFTSSSWRLITIDGTQKVCLDLKLAKSGNYSGVTVSYDSQGCIVFNFNYPENDVSDMVIVIDPGHGYISSGEYDPGALGRFNSLYCEEASVNLAVSIFLEQELTNMGAQVIRLSTESKPYATDERSDIARQYNPDLFISLHCNGSTSSSAQGSSTYFFQPFSYPLAKAVDDSLAKFYQDKIHGRNMSEGTRFDYFYVTTQPDFPSMLVEMGYITNYTEASVLNNPDYQKQIAQAIAQGISNYAQSFN